MGARFAQDYRMMQDTMWRSENDSGVNEATLGLRAGDINERDPFSNTFFELEGDLAAELGLVDLELRTRELVPLPSTEGAKAYESGAGNRAQNKLLCEKDVRIRQHVPVVLRWLASFPEEAFTDMFDIKFSYLKQGPLPEPEGIREALSGIQKATGEEEEEKEDELGWFIRTIAAVAVKTLGLDSELPDMPVSINTVHLWLFEHGFNLLDRFEGIRGIPIEPGGTSLSSAATFFMSFIDAMQIDASKPKARSIHHLRRTCCLHTEYIGTMDFTVGVSDKKFLFEKGKVTMELWLQKYLNRGGRLQHIKIEAPRQSVMCF